MGLKSLFPETNHIVDPDRSLGLHVVRSAAVEISVLFDHDEGIAGPVLAFRLHHIDMAEHQNCLGLGSEPWSTGDEAAFFWMAIGNEYAQIGSG